MRQMSKALKKLWHTDLLRSCYYSFRKMTDDQTNLTWKKNIDGDGRFVRKESSFRHFITADGSSGYKAEPNRYHLYVSLACPWAHRTLIVRKLKGLDKVITHTVVDWFLDDKGWTFTDKKPKCTLDTVNNCSTVRELYMKVNDEYDGRVTVPILWDKQRSTIVNNESSEIIRMFNTEFNAFCETEQQRQLDFYPEALQKDIDEVNSWVYNQVNNGVYKSGFARSQKAYDQAVTELFQGMDKVESILSSQRYLTGNQLTEADIRLFTTLIRFDKVYVGHFKCNKKRVVDYPNIWAFTRELYQIPEVADTVDMEHITKHYMMSHTSINPLGIVSIGPDLNFEEDHGRNTMK